MFFLIVLSYFHSLIFFCSSACFLFVSSSVCRLICRSLFFSLFPFPFPFVRTQASASLFLFPLFGSLSSSTRHELSPAAACRRITGACGSVDKQHNTDTHTQRQKQQPMAQKQVFEKLKGVGICHDSTAQNTGFRN